jgi:hypothetical protein
VVVCVSRRIDLLMTAYGFSGVRIGATGVRLPTTTGSATVPTRQYSRAQRQTALGIASRGRWDLDSQPERELANVVAERRPTCRRQTKLLPLVVPALVSPTRFGNCDAPRPATPPVTDSVASHLLVVLRPASLDVQDAAALVAALRAPTNRRSLLVDTYHAACCASRALISLITR